MDGMWKRVGFLVWSWHWKKTQIVHKEDYKKEMTQNGLIKSRNVTGCHTKNWLTLLLFATSSPFRHTLHYLWMRFNVTLSDVFVFFSWHFLHEYINLKAWRIELTSNSSSKGHSGCSCLPAIALLILSNIGLNLCCATYSHQRAPMTLISFQHRTTWELIMPLPCFMASHPYATTPTRYGQHSDSSLFSIAHLFGRLNWI